LFIKTDLRIEVSEVCIPYYFADLEEIVTKESFRQPQTLEWMERVIFSLFIQMQ
jgi:hypothetical protein